MAECITHHHACDCREAEHADAIAERDAEIARLRAKLSRKLIARADDARSFPANTCPASRHAHNIGYTLARGETFAQLAEEPVDCGESILATVAALYEARTELAALKARIAEARVCDGSDVMIWDDDAEFTDMAGHKRVRLLVEE
jgi:hypothetical protein